MTHPKDDDLVSPDEIYGNPREMMTWNPQDMATVYPANEINPAIDGAALFRTKDSVATNALVQLMMDAQMGFRAYHNKVKQSVSDYLNADEVSRGEILSVVGPRPMSAKDVTA